MNGLGFGGGRGCAGFAFGVDFTLTIDERKLPHLAYHSVGDVWELHSELFSLDVLRQALIFAGCLRRHLISINGSAG